MCSEGRIKGAVIKGNTWLIPEESEKPEDPRRIKNKEINNGVDGGFE